MEIKSIGAANSNAYKHQKSFKGVGSTELNNFAKFVCDEAQDADFLKLVSETRNFESRHKIPLTIAKTKAFLEKACEVLKIKDAKLPKNKRGMLIIEQEFPGADPTNVQLKIDDKYVLNFYNARMFGDQ